MESAFQVMQDVEAAINEGNERAILTHKMYAERVRQVVGGCDARVMLMPLLFTAGLGENDTEIRAAI